jgi:hypothetical protein
MAFWALMAWLGLSPLHLWVTATLMAPRAPAVPRPDAVPISQVLGWRDLTWAVSVWGALALGALLVWNARWLLRHAGAAPDALARRRRTLARMAWAIIGATLLASVLVPARGPLGWVESQPGLVNLPGWSVLETVWGGCLLGAIAAAWLARSGAHGSAVAVMKWSVLVAAGAWAALVLLNILLTATTILAVPVLAIPAVRALVRAVEIPVDPIIARLYFLTVYASGLLLWIAAYGVRPAAAAPPAGPIPLPSPGLPGPVPLPPPPAAPPPSAAPPPPAPELPRDPVTGRVRRRFG